MTCSPVVSIITATAITEMNAPDLAERMENDVIQLSFHARHRADRVRRLFRQPHDGALIDLAQRERVALAHHARALGRRVEGGHEHVAPRWPLLDEEMGGG